MRARVSFNFFKDLCEQDFEKIERYRKTWNGLYVYGTDGIQLTLPRTDDVVEAGYSGRKVSKYRESYMPKMFMTGALDVINGVIKDLREHPTLNEIADAHSLVRGLEDNSLSIYDRLYCSRELIHLHHDCHNYFLFRLRKSVIKELKVIFKSKRKKLTVVVDGITVYLIRMYNPKTQEFDYFASNLPKRLVTEKKIRSLYNLRWEVENSFRDFTQTLRLEQWHSKSINGIRQELYVAVWLYNFVKMKILSKHNPTKDCMETIYKKPNFKFIFGWVTSKLFEILKGVRGVLKDLVELINKSMETRKRHSRSYRREIKSPRSPFPYNNTRWNLG
jgi:Transposase DDE domain